MIYAMRTLGLWVALIAALGVSACGGSGGPTASPQNFVSAEAAMAASAESYQNQVQSFEGTMSVGFSAGAEDFSTSGDMRFEAPDKVYFSMSIPDTGEMEVLLNGNEIYFAMEDKWYLGDASALGIDLSQFQKYLEDRGPLDYADALTGLRDVVKLSDEDIDGDTFWHYHAALDLEALAGELPVELADPALIQQATDALGTPTMEVFIDPVTLLPRRYTMQMSMNFGSSEGAISMNMQMDFVKYNEDVDMPDVPTGAEPFDAADLLGLGSS